MQKALKLYYYCISRVLGLIETFCCFPCLYTFHEITVKVALSMASHNDNLEEFLITFKLVLSGLIV